jgi:tetratricopeptide (TPR) repeat protein
LARTLVIFTLLFFFSRPLLFGQDSKLDSLKQVLNQELNDSTELRVLAQIINLIPNSQLEENLEFINRQNDLAKSSGNKKAEASANHNYGNYENWSNNFRLAIEYFEKEIALSEIIGFEEGMANAYHGMGQSYQGLYDFSKSIDHYLKAAELYKKIGENRKLAICYNGVATIFEDQNLFRKSAEYLELARKIFSDIGYEFGLAATSINLGNTYSQLGNREKALEGYLAGLEWGFKLDNQYVIATCYLNMGTIYDDDFEDYPTALEYYIKSLGLFRELGIRPSEAICLGNIGSLYVKTGKFIEARQYLLKALILAEKIQSQIARRLALEGYYKLYSELGDFQKALEYHKRYSQTKDSIISESNLGKVNELETRFRTQMKEDEILILKKEKEFDQAMISKQKTIRSGLIIGLGLIMIFSTLLVLGFRKSLKTNRKLSETRDEVMRQKDHDQERIKRIEELESMIDSQVASEKMVSNKLQEEIMSKISDLKTDLNEILVQKGERDFYIKIQEKLIDIHESLKKIVNGINRSEGPHPKGLK